VTIFCWCCKIKVSILYFGSDSRLCSSNALDLIRLTLVRNSAGLLVTKTSMRHYLLQSLHRRGELQESPSNVVLSFLLLPLLFSSLEHLTSVFIWKVPKSATINPQTILPMVYRGLQFPQQDNVILH
jgi:hypothetical protein